MFNMKWLEEVQQNLRYAVRTLRHSPMFTAVAVLSLALGVGANTAVFSFMRGIVMKQLPVPGADRLVVIRQTNERFNMENCCFRFGFFSDLRREALDSKLDSKSDFEDILALTSPTVKFTDREQTERLEAETVSGNYFRMLGVRPALGRLLDDSDDQVEGASPVCVISYRLWMERYAGDRNIIGRRVLIDSNPFQIVGVTEQGFTGASLHHPHDLQIPSSMVAQIFGMKRDTFGWAQLIGRLKSGITVEQAEARVQVTARRIYTSAGWEMRPRDRFLLKDGSQGLDSRKEQFGRPVQILMLLVGVVLLVACANLAALLLVRGVARTREAGVRLALGASRAALVRRFLTESMAIAIAGGVAGWGLAVALSRVLLGMIGDRDAGLAAQVAPDRMVFLFAAGVTLLAGLLFGAWPAWRTSRADPLHAIHGIPSFSSPRRQTFASRALMAGQIALSLALVFGAGLFSRTLTNMRGIDLGFRPENLVTIAVDVADTTHGGAGAEPFFTDLLQRATSLPEVRAASYASVNLLSGSMSAIVLKIPGYVPSKGSGAVTNMMTISSGFFRTYGIPLLAGRDFTPEDRGKDNVAVIVNQQFAKQFFGGDALGKTLAYGGGINARVVGVAANTKYRFLKESQQPLMYLAVTQRGFPQNLYLQVRTSSEAPAMIERLRAMVREMDPRMPAGELTTMAMQLDRVLSRERLLAFLSTLLGGLALTLAAIGLYGVLSFSVARRTREIGIRMAIGAPRVNVLGMFLLESVWIVAAGAALGIPLALGCGKLASTLLYGVEGQDPRIAAGATAILALVALAAALIPAARAARVDPLRALRHE